MCVFVCLFYHHYYIILCKCVSVCVCVCVCVCDKNQSTFKKKLYIYLHTMENRHERQAHDAGTREWMQRINAVRCMINVAVCHVVATVYCPVAGSFFVSYLLLAPCVDSAASTRQIFFVGLTAPTTTT